MCDSICRTRKRRKSAAVPWSQSVFESCATGVRSISRAIALEPGLNFGALPISGIHPESRSAHNEKYVTARHTLLSG